MNLLHGFTLSRRWMAAHPLSSLLLILTIVLLVPGIILAARDLIPPPAQLDFATYYLAAQAVNQGYSP
jgi:hypothetical protein